MSLERDKWFSGNQKYSQVSVKNINAPNMIIAVYDHPTSLLKIGHRSARQKICIHDREQKQGQAQDKTSTAAPLYEASQAETDNEQIGYDRIHGLKLA